MPALVDLWLPILLSAVFVFIASSIIHMAIPIHKSDNKALPGEDKILAAMREQGLQPGDYMFPFCSSMKDMGSPEMQEKWKRGPAGNMTVLRGSVNMGRSLLQWFLLTVVMSVFVAYVGSFCLPVGAGYAEVFRLTGTVAILGYAPSTACNSIWKGVAWSTTWKFILDGVVYGLVTAGTFGWLWPHAPGG